jgi:hypothetical protein
VHRFRTDVAGSGFDREALPQIRGDSIELDLRRSIVTSPQPSNHAGDTFKREPAS